MLKLLQGKRIAYLIAAFITIALLTALSCRTYEIAGGPIDVRRLDDGAYRGRSRYGPVRVRVEVTVEDGLVTGIELLRHFHGRGGEAEQPVIERIIRQQSTDVDAVTGATGSSIAIMNAVEDALSGRRRRGNSQ